MQIFHGRQTDAVSELRSSTFSGTVYADPVMPTADGVTINNVFFAPGARTFWHTHEVGQVLTVIAGEGWVCVDGQDAQKLTVGDIVWIPKGQRHWHGATATSYLLHTAVSIGQTVWEEEVTDDQFGDARR
jgi:Uncharacterized conserved protein, contains double-stranded beta-helix domain